MNENTPSNLTRKQARSKKIFAWVFRLAIFIGSAFLATAVIRFETDQRVESREFLIGEPAPRTVFSPYEFSYENKKATQDLREKAGRTVFPVYRMEAHLEKEAFSRLESFFRDFRESLKVSPDPRNVQIQGLPFEIPKASVKFLAENPAVLSDAERSVRSLMKAYFEKGVFDSAVVKGLTDASVPQLILVPKDSEEEIQISVQQVQVLDQARKFAEAFLSEEIQKNRPLKNAVLDIWEGIKTANVRLDEKQTSARQKKAAEGIPSVMAKIQKNELIVQRGVLVTPADKERLDQIQKQLDKRKVLNLIFATLFFVFLAYTLVFIQLWIFARKIFWSLRWIFLIHSVFLVTLLVCKAAAVWPGSSYYLMPTALAPLLLILLTRERIAFLAAIVMPILIAPLAAFSPEVILATLVSGFFSVFAGRKIRKRIQFLQAGLALGLSYASVIFLYRIFNEYPVAEAFQTGCLGIANGVLVTILLLVLLVPLFENIFKLTTDITLLELSDLNHPLLRRMIVEAPGTYHHSLVVATLAEAACEGIGANPLLARVGCYFHDIGKIAHAEFFTENQANKHRTQHDQITPRMSSTIIMNHVRDGVELGRKYRLKEPILKFIPEHQGTGIVYYFYRKALDHAKPGEAVNPHDYRYPGPKPQSRETAVALLADSTEAASRSLKEPTPDSIRQLVRKIINDKFIDGQLDECDLTLKDLHKIQESFVRNLMAIFHTRVPYPLAPESPDKPDLFQEGPLSKPGINSVGRPEST